jgi:NifU-like protein involved in Fe-S cluster formation
LFLLRSFLTLFKNNTLLLWGKEISSIYKVKKGNKNMNKKLEINKLRKIEHLLVLTNNSSKNQDLKDLTEALDNVRDMIKEAAIKNAIYQLEELERK